MTPTLVALSLVALLLVAGGAFFWQERRRLAEAEVVYGVEDALGFVMSRLSDTARDQVRAGDVRRILEWEVRYLQDPELSGDGPAVVGGVEAAEYAQRMSLAQGHPYDGAVILEVLELQAEYLAALGAVGPPVETTEVQQLVDRWEGEATT